MGVMVHSRHVVIPEVVRVRTARGAAAAAGWWVVAGVTCVAAYQPKGAASLAASYSNLANPGTNNAAWTGNEGENLRWDEVNGWKVLSSNWLTTGIMPNQDFTLIYRYSNCDRGDGGCGANTSGNRFYILGNYGALGNKILWGYAGEIAYPVAAETTSGVVALAGPNRYLNGLTQGSFSVATFATANALTMGHAVGANSGGIYLQCVAIWAGILDATQVATVSAAMAAL